MSQGFATRDGRWKQLCGTPTEAREAETGQAPDGQTISKKLVGPHWFKVVRDRNDWKVLGNQLNAVNHSRGLAQRVSLY